MTNKSKSNKLSKSRKPKSRKPRNRKRLSYRKNIKKGLVLSGLGLTGLGLAAFLYKNKNKKNRLCDKDNLQCIGQNVEKISTEATPFSSGGFGSIYNVVIKGNGEKFEAIVKTITLYIKTPFMATENDCIKYFNNEVGNGKLMDKFGIGPKIYDNYYVKIPKNEIKLSSTIETDQYTNQTGKIPVSGISEYDALRQYIYMEKFEGSIEKLSYLTTSYPSISKQLLKLIHTQVFTAKLYCIDIKPQNVVYRRKDTSKNLTDDNIEVKLIDFGECSNNKPGKATDEVLYVINLMQIIGMMYVASKTLMMGMINPIDPLGIKPTLKPFFEDSLLVKYINNPYFIDLLLEYTDSMTNVTYAANYGNYVKTIALFAPSFSYTKFTKLSEDLENKFKLIGGSQTIGGSQLIGSPTIAALFPVGRDHSTKTQQKIVLVMKSKLKEEKDALFNYLFSKQVELIKSLQT